MRKLFALASGARSDGSAARPAPGDRLDALVLRAGLARSIYQARQFVTHGHFDLNGLPHDIPSARLGPGDRFAVREASRKLPVFNLDRPSVTVPPYLEVSEDGYGATLVRLPERQEIPVVCQEQLVVEFYSR